MNSPFEPPFCFLVKGYLLTFPQGVPVRNGQGNAVPTGILEEAEGEGDAPLRVTQFLVETSWDVLDATSWLGLG